MLLINFLVASHESHGIRILNVLFLHKAFTEPAEVESEGGRGNLFYSKENRIAEKEAHQIDYQK